MKKLLLCSIAAIAVCLLLLSFNKRNAPELSQADRDFMTKAAIANMAEIQAGQLALGQGISDTVKTFGQNMVTDHTTCLTELKAIADSMQVTLPSQPDNEHAMVLQTLMQKKGHDFDRAYLMAQLKGHQQAVALFKTEWNSTTNTRLKAFTAKYLPIIQMHLQMVQSAGGMQGMKGM
ncbi:DUF4142 domain-containing protein [Deminuibacter soli]|uniref:DUF4142 domain-containing protein n=1 Tax=Deminuibacter soli TaxID=2291815 RepID=A0A3E1NLK5_9BACT|nr:DUF4142 domain-containing protein [Deminuibacter soli]RFM28820.1 DUF4142 domain-containing protein [Deminuibacter soli]